MHDEPEEVLMVTVPNLHGVLLLGELYRYDRITSSLLQLPLFLHFNFQIKTSVTFLSLLLHT